MEIRVKALLATVRTDSDAIGALLETIAGSEAQQVVNGRGALEDPDAALDKAAELQRRWDTQPGQLWAIDSHRLLCADCRQAEQVQRLWQDGARFRQILTDPPYGVGYAAKNQYLNRSDRGNRIQKPIENDHLSPAETALLFQTALQQSLPYALPGAAVYASVPSGPLLPRFIAAFEAAGFSYKHMLVWIKSNFVISMADYHARHEVILYGWRENGPHYFTSDRRQDSVFEVDKPRSSEFHPTTKPVELLARMISNSSRPGEVIFDPFSGSGSTLLAAHQLGRVGYSVEIDPGYVAVALQRLTQLGLKPRLLDRWNEV